MPCVFFAKSHGRGLSRCTEMERSDRFQSCLPRFGIIRAVRVFVAGLLLLVALVPACGDDTGEDEGGSYTYSTSLKNGVVLVAPPTIYIRLDRVPERLPPPLVEPKPPAPPVLPPPIVEPKPPAPAPPVIPGPPPRPVKQAEASTRPQPVLTVPWADEPVPVGFPVKSR